jgi:sec-independent protein translocase protein TatA
MGIGGISPGSLILILLIIVLLFGTKKLSTLGEDIGKALQGFRKGMKGLEDHSGKKGE